MKDLNRHRPEGDIQIASMDVKRRSTSYVIRELQIKTMVRYHHVAYWNGQKQDTDNTKF